MLRQWKTDKHVYGPSIKITSPEQFVPLYLAATSPVVYPVEHNINVSEFTDGQIRTPDGQNHTTDKDFIRQYLIDELNHPYPSEYSFPVPKNTYLYNITDPGMSSHHIEAILQGADYGPDEFFVGNIVNFGVWVSIQGNVEINNPMSTLFPYSSNVARNVVCFDSNRLNPHLIILIKAKTIPYVRARFTLGLPLSLTYSDVKVLRNSNSGVSVPEALRRFITNLQPTVEYGTSTELLKYLIGPELTKFPSTAVGRKEVVDKAKRILENPSIVKPAVVYG